MTDAAQTLTPTFLERLPTASPNGEVARVLLSFLATAGFFYINIMPAFVDGLITALDFTSREAGLVGSANMYGAALGALTAVFVVKSINWKKTAVIMLLTLMTLDLSSVWVQEPQALMALRFAHGCFGGLLVGIGFAIISRTLNTERTFGYLLSIQFGLGGLGLMYLPGLVPDYGLKALLVSLALFSFVTLCMLPFMADYPVSKEKAAATASQSEGVNWGPLMLALLTTFLFQAANMGIYAYIMSMGKHYGLDEGFISSTLGVAAWIAIAGSVLVIFISTRFGRLWPLTVSMSITAVGTWLLHYSGEALYYWIANVGVGITWAFGISYLLGMCSAFDASGQMAALGGFASKMGLASGPMVAALLMGGDDYTLVINVAVVVFVVAALVVVIPARVLDRADQTAV